MAFGKDMQNASLANAESISKRKFKRRMRRRQHLLNKHKLIFLHSSLMLYKIAGYFILTSNIFKSSCCVHPKLSNHLLCFI